MGKAIGIDLGTTNSVVAHEDHTGVRVILNQSNERLTRSVVGIHPKGGDLLVGSTAVDNAARNPENTVFAIKRLMGRFYDDPNVAEAQQRNRYRIVKPPDGDDARVMLGSQMHTPTEISAMILRKLKADAEARLGEEVTHAVITVPAYFSVNQRQATRQAGELAGLRVKNIISEPTAAAMAFGVDMEPGAMKNVLVYDFGGGTFDISILFISGEMFTEMAIEGDMWLGGDDFDHAILSHALKEIEREYKTTLSDDGGRFQLLLRKEVEKAKVRLSEMSSAAIVLDAIVPLPSGERGDVDVELTRRDFEDLPISDRPIRFGGVDSQELRSWCEELKINGTYSDSSVAFGPDTVRNRVKKSILLVRKAMKEAGLTKDQIDHVLLVGGSTTVPLVQRMLEEEFGREKIMRNINPMECVAVGAGLAAERIPGIICQNTLGQDGDGKERVCMAHNAPTATVCHGCGAELVAQKPCPTCRHPNSLDAERCANPAGCSHSFARQMSHFGVMSKPVGLLDAGDQFAVILPKSTPYPTPEPVIQQFRTASDASKAVRLPIYHAEVAEFDANDVNQWIGAADINLEGAHLPAGTRVDVSIAVDRDGCVEIEAIIQDGSGRRQKIFIDPRIGAGRRVAPGGNGDGADVQPEVQSPPEWENRLWWSMTAAEIALRDYEWLFSDHHTTPTLQKFAAEAKEVIKRKDETRGRALEKEIDEALEGALKGCMPLLYAEMRCLNSYLEPGIKSQLRSLIKEICDGLRTHRPISEIQMKMDRLIELLNATKTVGLDEGHTRKDDTRVQRA